MIKPSLFDSIFGIISPILILVLIIPFAYGQDVICDALECDEIFSSTPPFPQEICTAEFAPVCAGDITTFSNACEAGNVGARILHLGECVLTEVTEEDAIKISQELGFERIEITAFITTTYSDGTSFTISTEPNFLTGIINARLPPASIVAKDKAGADVTDGKLQVLLEFKSNELRFHDVIVSGFITVHSTWRNSETLGTCAPISTEPVFFTNDFRTELRLFEECLIELHQSNLDIGIGLEEIKDSGDFVGVDKQFPFASKGESDDDGIFVAKILDERFDDLLKISNPELNEGEQFLIVDLSELIYTSFNKSYYLNFADIGFFFGDELLFLNDPFYVSLLNIEETEPETVLTKAEIEIILKDQIVDIDIIPPPIPERPDIEIISDDLIGEEQSFFQPVIDFFQSIASFFQGLFGGGQNGENGGEVPDGVALCIDGIYFGVCTGDQHFDSDQACFGLTTQQCFDKCNVIGTTCRIE